MQKKLFFLLGALPYLASVAAAEEEKAEATEGTEAAEAAKTEEAEKPAEAAAAKTDDGDDDDDDMEGDDSSEDPDDNDPLFADDAAGKDPKSPEEMKQQMAELMKLLEDKDSSVPGETKDQLKGLLDQLKKLGISADELKNMQGDATDTLSAAELNTPTNLMTACGNMASTYYGLKRKDEKLAQFGKIKVATEPKEVLDNPMMHLIVACADDLSSDELRDALKNKYRRMPKRILDQLKNKDADLPSKVKELSMELFEALQQVTEAQLAAAAARKTSSSGQKKEKPRRDMPQIPRTEMPGWVSVAALLLFFGTVALLMYKFIMMQQEINNAKLASKAQKEKKKNK